METEVNTKNLSLSFEHELYLVTIVTCSQRPRDSDKTQCLRLSLPSLRFDCSLWNSCDNGQCWHQSPNGKTASDLGRINSHDLL